MATPNACSFVRYEQCQLLHRLACVGCVSGRERRAQLHSAKRGRRRHVFQVKPLVLCCRWLSSADVAHQGITGAITGRAIYEGTLDITKAQALADTVSRS